MIYDISPLLSPRLAVWPGDMPLSREVTCDLARGDAVTLSSLRATVHLGSHADAPIHYVPGPAIHERDLELYLGPAQLIRVEVARGMRILPEQLRCEVRAPRVLLCTGTYPDPEKFTTDFASLSVALVDYLAAKGVRLIGIDTPSVDLFSSTDFEAHHAIARHDIAILEGLVLAEVPEGVYELIALPLRLEGFDASPVRAVLRNKPPA